MMFGRKQQTISHLCNRVKELEDIICPFASHEWVWVGRQPYNAGNTVDFIYKYQCSKCKRVEYDYVYRCAAPKTKEVDE